MKKTLKTASIKVKVHASEWHPLSDGPYESLAWMELLLKHPTLANRIEKLIEPFKAK